MTFFLVLINRKNKREKRRRRICVQSFLIIIVNGDRSIIINIFFSLCNYNLGMKIE
jgi:hypothetical protein